MPLGCLVWLERLQPRLKSINSPYFYICFIAVRDRMILEATYTHLVVLGLLLRNKRLFYLENVKEQIDSAKLNLTYSFVFGPAE